MYIYIKKIYILARYISIYIYVSIYLSIYMYIYMYIYTMYIYRKLFHYTPMINSKNKLETLVWQLMNGQPKISSERGWK